MNPSVFLASVLLMVPAACLGVDSPLRAHNVATRQLHQQNKDHRNGAKLSVNISFPAMNASLPMAFDSPVLGSASIGKGNPDVSYIYIIDTSESTSDPDGDCGTVLDCVQDFFKELHKEARSDGSAELASVINFDSTASISVSLLHPASAEVRAAFEAGSSSGTTNCVEALQKATELVQHPNNTASTTIVVFSGDGLCNSATGILNYSATETEVQEAADELGATGAIVHSVAVGDNVDCDVSQYGEPNMMLDIPKNGGNCTSVPEPGTLPHIIDTLIGTTLTSLEMQVDGGNFSDINASQLTEDLPREGPISIHFNTSVSGLAVGSHEICVRASGEDVLGGLEEIVDCHVFAVVAPPTPETTTTAPTVSPTDPPTTKSAASPRDEEEPEVGPKVSSKETKTNNDDNDAHDEVSGGLVFLFVAVALACVILLAFGAKVVSRGYCAGQEATQSGMGRHEEFGGESGGNSPSAITAVPIV